LTGVDTASPPPSADDQLVFLSKLQRLLAEGDFTATYKFALLIALGELAVEEAADDGRPLELKTRQIAERFIALYWNHVTPFGGHAQGDGGIELAQVLGSRAAVLGAISEFRQQSGIAGLAKAKVHPSYVALVTRVARVVADQPLNYLQNFGGGTDEFLYTRPSNGTVQLRPGVAFCLRRFFPLIQQLCRNHWVEHIKSNKRNQAVLGPSADLDGFLFATSRQSLAIIGRELRKLDGASCFYCGQGLTEHDVDHFIPFSLYPRDLAANFVLAHPGCNRSKSDTLAARRHLDRWLERLLSRSDDLCEIGGVAGVPGEPHAIRRVAAWSYTSALRSNAKAWLEPSRYEPVDAGYLELLA
jgi:5-methylcytosine-specific restriction endonuclease McrA